MTNRIVGMGPHSLTRETSKTTMAIPNDILNSLMTSVVHKDDRIDYVRSLEMEIARLRQGLLNDALRGRLAYQLRMHSRDILTMTAARKIVDTAVTDALKGGSP